MFGKKDSSKSPRETNGPVVKTGPTAGQNRSRNKDGSWREKRSDTGTTRSKNEKSGCFLTSAACQYCGLPDDCHELQTLRAFRDGYLAEVPGGPELVQRYYEIAPAIVARLDDRALARIWTVIQQCVGFIEAERPADAKNAYVEMTKSLEGTLLGPEPGPSLEQSCTEVRR